MVDNISHKKCTKNEMNDNSDMKLFNFYSIKLLKKHFKNQQPMLTEIDHHRVSEQYMQNNLHECTTI